MLVKNSFDETQDLSGISGESRSVKRGTMEKGLLAVSDRVKNNSYVLYNVYREGGMLFQEIIIGKNT